MTSAIEEMWECGNINGVVSPYTSKRRLMHAVEYEYELVNRDFEVEWDHGRASSELLALGGVESSS